MPRRITHVLFDLDGTLADTAPDLGAALNRTLRDHGREPLPLATIRPWASRGGGAMIRLGFQIDEAHPEFVPLRDEFLRQYRDGLAIDTVLFPGVEELLRKLEAGDYVWGIVTNKISALTDPLLVELGLKQRAACVVSGDTAARPKPHPDPLLHARGLLGCRSDQIVYVGDDRRDVEAGRGAGTSTVVARYGYFQPDDVPEQWGADAVIERPLELLPWLERAG